MVKKYKNIQITDLANYSNLDCIRTRLYCHLKKWKIVWIKVTQGEFEGDELSNQGYKHEDKLYIFIDQYVEGLY